MIQQRPTIAIACGGTGGHFLPGLSIAREFKRRGIKPLLFIGGHHPSEQLMTAQEVGIAAVASPTVRAPSSRLKWPIALIKMAGCIYTNKRLLKEHQVDAALGMGSFASVPMAMAAAQLKLPLFLHEGNAIMGRANRRLSRSADTVFLSLPLRRPVAGITRSEIVGMPIRGQLRRSARKPLDPERRARIRQELGLDPDLPVLLVFGGSQGARFLNNLMVDVVPLLDDARLKMQIIHLTGSHHNDDYDLLYKSMDIRSLVRKRDRHMQRLYNAADLVLCRAGASTIFELALFGKPAILVPMPTALDGHQKANAETLLDAEAALMIEEKLLEDTHLASMLRNWTSAPHMYDHLAANIRQFAAPDAVRNIVDSIITRANLTPDPTAAEDPPGDTACIDGTNI